MNDVSTQRQAGVSAPAVADQNGYLGHGTAELASAALAYVERGWKPIPLWPIVDGRCGCPQPNCEDAGKHPRVKWRDADPDPATVEEWWRRWPDSGIGLLTGSRSGLTVLDVDPRHNGDESLHELESKHGELPPTPRVETGSGGEHYYFAQVDGARNSASALGEGLDVRGEGGFVVAPPSPHASGGEYCWDVEPAEAEPAPPPAWLLEDVKKRRNGTAPKIGATIKHGSQHETLVSLGGSMRRRGMGEAEIVAALKVVNRERCEQPGTDAAMEEIAASVCKYEPAEDGDAKKSQATKLVELAESDELFHAADAGYARFAVGLHHEIAPLRTRPYRARLARRYYENQGKAPSTQALQDALSVLEGRALYEGEEHPVATRLAEHGGAIYLDLANSEWEAVEIDANGWRVVTDPPVRFRRPKGTGELPRPVPGELEPLRELVNVEAGDWPVFVGYLLAALNPSGPFPVLELHGEQGTAKSTTARMTRGLVDPNDAPLRAAPRNGHDLMIGANNAWMIALDNLSHVQPWLSDGICRLATGGGFATRTLYENDEEHIFHAMRPVLLNGIGAVAERSDLVDRAIVLEAPRIRDQDRLTETEINRRFNATRPAILGALLDGVVRGLRDVATVELADPPRMADFAEWAVAAGPGVGVPADTFLDAYAENRALGSGAVLESSPVTATLLELANDGFEGTATELLAKLTGKAGETETRAKDWPRSATALGKLLTRLAPNLRDAGYLVERPSRGRRRLWAIRRVEGT